MSNIIEVIQEVKQAAYTVMFIDLIATKGGE